MELEALRPDWDRRRILQAVEAAGVPCYTGSCSEIYRELAFERAGLGPAEPHPVAAELGETALMFLVHPTLSAAAIERTVDVVNDVLAAATR